jgi:UDP-2,3-diacylglucosamine hydrolase
MMPKQGRIYFLSDFHLGAPNAATSLQREKKIVSFLDEISKDATEIFILGDLFDFWFEYRKVVPKGFVRILGKLASIADGGVPIHFFTGNHDMWMKNYFQKEMSINVYHEPTAFELQNKKLLIGHGDGLGPGDHGYKFLKKIFRNPIAQFCFGIIPPVIGIGMANYFSRKSRAKTGKQDEIFEGEENEWLVAYSKEILAAKYYDYFVFGHRHLPLDISLSPNSTYINLGDWITHFSYAVMDDGILQLKYHKD